MVVYSSKYGATKKAAELLREQLLKDGAERVELINLKTERPQDLSGFDTVAVGSSVYIGSINKKVKRFLEENKGELLRKKLGLFLCAGAEKQEDLEKIMSDNFNLELRSAALVTGYFGHAYYVDRMGLFDKMIIKKVGNVTENRENLDQKAIEAFAMNLTK